ncbi:Wzz/FepE/Etk N-terminal domain-containing protein [Poseidonibacter ostreae]|uniref:Polysaccharide chain length determinant N-terminal domain-containing protein n=1 Tax=Poseidonibacter ostreae TaxID=2654171 RepID=A0A6L4WUL2_9BACT|nr:Wzz/FepE/Etk N-terminal domain-containing protein [Poseidonibacter ostreae]KAB7889876.1 hypothetical protein GBG19_04825 [Poseidonibacter ostreae]KAB7890197.1 hypothetical protein GBG18_09400 [Poseidonibacter ostreae]
MSDENKIDLIELFSKIYQKKKYILSVVICLTLLATIYTYMKTPIYEARAFVKAGNYYDLIESDVINKKTKEVEYFESVRSKFTVSSEVIVEMIKNRFQGKNINNAIISYVWNYPKKDGYFSIKSHSSSKEIAAEHINYVLSEISKEVNSKSNLLLEYKQSEKEKVQNELVIINSFLLVSQNRIKDLQRDNRAILKDKLFDAQYKEYSLKVKKEELILRSKRLESELIRLSDRSLELVDEIVVKDSPIKPNKRKIIIMAFIGSLFLALITLPFLYRYEELKSKRYND